MKLATIVMIIFLALNFTINSNAANLEETRKYFGNLLHQICMIGPCSERPNPYREEGADDIIGSSIILAYYDNMESMDKFNKPLRSMGIENVHIIPEKLVENAICKYYGFNQSKYETLQKAAEKRMFTYGFYSLGSGDPGIIDFNVEKVVQLKNGLVRVTGTMGDGEMSPFKAFFKKSDCGGHEHWVLLKMVDMDIAEESDDFYVPEDK